MEMTCKEMVELITDYLEGVLPEGDRLNFERHLEGCRGCTAYLSQMRQTIQLAGILTEESLSEKAKVELLEVFRDWKSGFSSGHKG